MLLQFRQGFEFSFGLIEYVHAEIAHSEETAV